MVKPCWRIGGGMERSKINPRNNDGLTWYKDIGFHAFGEFSMAMTQANSVMEDQCQIESGPLTFNNPAVEGTFVGVYDGHGGPEASRFIADNIFYNLKKIASEDRAISEEVMRKVYAETEEDFMVEVKKQWRKKPEMASVGSCCLTGVICDGLVYIANAGDSRAVLGRCERGSERGVKAIELSVEHNANVETARKEMWSMHPNDPNILVMKHGKWRVKGVIDVTRSIGDAYLKRTEFNREPLMQKFRLPEDLNKPILSADPSVSVTRLNREDEFIILASDGLWEQLGNQEAVDIVHNSPRRQGIARRLIKAALKEAAKKREMRYSDLKEIDSGVRRHFHDDICVIVVYLKPNASSPPLLSIRGGYPL